MDDSNHDMVNMLTQQNDDGGEDFSVNPPWSIFNYPGRPFGKCTTSTLDYREMKAAHLYILLNCPEVVPYLNMYSDLLRELDPELNELDLDKQVSTTFPTSFNTYVRDSRNGINDVLLKSLAWGPIRNVIKWSRYVINGYKFVTKSQNEGMSTTNHNVCVRGGQLDSLENDYYGVLIDIVELEYTGHPTKKVVLFQCDWFDPSPQGTKMDNYGNVEIKKSRRYKNYDPFILAQQANQIYFTSFRQQDDDDVHQQPIVVSNDDFHQCLVDINGEEEVPISLLKQLALLEEKEEEEKGVDEEEDEWEEEWEWEEDEDEGEDEEEEVYGDTDSNDGFAA
ncbi:hypothetical protein QL285_057599 [Trifolium repens]|nr:hypothetical protein QL285_057599 [Trifolium repens]